MTGRRPLGKEAAINYQIDSDDEWANKEAAVDYQFDSSDNSSEECASEECTSDNSSEECASEECTSDDSSDNLDRSNKKQIEYENDYDANKACCSKTTPLFRSEKLVNKRSIVFSSSDRRDDKRVKIEEDAKLNEEKTEEDLEIDVLNESFALEIIASRSD